MKWTEEKKKMLTELSPYNSDAQVAEIFTQTFGERYTEYAIRRHRQRMGIKKLHGRGKIGLAPNQGPKDEE